MLNFKFTKHAENKFKTENAKKFGISKKKLTKIIIEPVKKIIQTEGVNIAIGYLDKEHSLCVVYKLEDDIIKVITFFPAKKGRYET